MGWGTISSHMSATNYKGGISLAGRHVAVIGLSFRESSYSLGFKNTQFSITNALNTNLSHPQNRVQRKLTCRWGATQL